MIGTWLIPAGITVLAFILVAEFGRAPASIDKQAPNNLADIVAGMFEDFAGILIRVFLALLVSAVAWIVWLILHLVR